ncbi:RICIN domain-containing protein [Streptomyces sp. NPDC049577]|uniref:RICIN domain-containing protein n=1 Tax=Streptomyces sp. NPDC049577 TaxID=3155153 RepID=UPI00343731B1
MDECKRNLAAGNSEVYNSSRFSMCTGAKVIETFTNKSGAVGTASMWVFVRGAIGKHDRTVRFDYDFQEFERIGFTQTDKLLIIVNSKPPSMTPSSAQADIDNDLPQDNISYDRLSTMNPAHFKDLLTVRPGQGDGRADTVYTVYRPYIILKIPPYNIPDDNLGRLPHGFPLRWDNAPEIATKSGGATFGMIPTLHYSTASDAPERGVAEHIKMAYTDPDKTVPKANQKKIFPGNNKVTPLHRLYSDMDRRNKNTSLAVAACVKYFGDNYTQSSIPGKKNQCDEFPFATTMEGAAQYDKDRTRSPGPNNYSALPVDADQNGAAGQILAGFYTKNRIIEGYDDAFMVDVDQSMSAYQMRLVNYSSGKCLEIDGSSTTNGARAQQWDCVGQPGADWILKPEGAQTFRIVNANSEKCLEVADSRTDNGAPVQQWDCVPGAKTQIWSKLDIMDPQWHDYIGTVLENERSGKALEIDGSSKQNGALAQQWDYKGQGGARWKMGAS